MFQPAPLRPHRHPRRRRRSPAALLVGLLVLSAVAVVSAGVAAAAPAAKGKNFKLSSASDIVTWKGSVGIEDAPKGGEPAECQSVQCDHFTVTIDLPKNIFNIPNKRGGVQFAIRWFGDPGPEAQHLPPGVPPCCGEFDALNLYVYKDNVLYGASSGIIATGASALLPSPPNGVYDVWIASDPIFNVHPSVAYEALAQVEYTPKIQPVRRLLPDLTFRGSRIITFDTPSFPLFEPDPAPGESCFSTEKIEAGAQNCLRFDQIIANIGQAPLELRFAVPYDQNNTAKNVYQRVFSSDGSHADQPAGAYEFHEIHQHYHYTSFASTALWSSNKKGQKLGTVPLREGEKVSFCIADIEIDAWKKRGDGPRHYYAPDCLYPQASDANFEYLIQGLTNGWSDIYEWYLPDQYIEVTGVPDGYYRLEFCADPDGEIEEANETNNCSAHLVRLLNMGTPQKTVINLGPTK